MAYQIEKQSPYLIMGGKPISNITENVDEQQFFEKMKELIGEEKLLENKDSIIKHLKKPDTFIQIGDYIFSCPN